ncbi:hypothetical protein C5B92_07050 [Rathayibacter sp. AY1A4]|nr:hypothetical protein C5B92_07050 [Rathayibacter sp. AY1A4]
MGHLRVSTSRRRVGESMRVNRSARIPGHGRARTAGSCRSTPLMTSSATTARQFSTSAVAVTSTVDAGVAPTVALSAVGAALRGGVR